MRSLPTLVLLVSVSTVARTTFAEDDQSPLTNLVRTPTVRFALESAARAALERLERPECGQVLSDFRDGSGRTLQENLDLLGRTPRVHLRLLIFRDGFGQRRCQDPTTLAVTSIGGREIFICGDRFAQTYRMAPRHVEALMIHEVMHTLGLGENPPSSPEITARVLKRCW